MWTPVLWEREDKYFKMLPTEIFTHYAKCTLVLLDLAIHMYPALEHSVDPDQLTDLNLHGLSFSKWIINILDQVNSDWLKIGSGHILIYSAWQGLNNNGITSKKEVISKSKW